MTIRKSQLWKSLSPCVRRKDWPVLERELQRVETVTPSFMPAERGLVAAFVWEDSPQGFDFWQELSDRLTAAGYGDVA